MIDVEKEIAKKFPKFKNNKVVKKAVDKFANSFVHQKEINEFLDNNSHLDSFGFIQAVLEHFNFDFSTKDKELENIPSNGRVVVVANHPLGGLDALALIELISHIRKDIKIVANDFLEGFEPLKPLMISINNFESRQKKESIGQIYEALNNDELLIIFPAGEVSRLGATGVKDGKWSGGFLNFAKRTNAPILPICIGGKNSATFYSVSTLNKKLATLLLADEMFKQRGKTIEINIGELIPSSVTASSPIVKDQLLKLFRKQVYAIKKNKSYFHTQKAIAHPVDMRHIKKELAQSQRLGETKDGKAIYLYEPKIESCELLKELGRLREMTFRKVGEGVNKRRDIDKYDNYYKHIVLFDEALLEVVGAYRIADVASVVANEGIGGLYTATLFDFEPAFEDKYLQNSIELGRSFVQPKYWGSRALDYLWQGIGAYLKANSDIKYMFGPVTLSATYPQVAKDMILYFYDKYFGSEHSLVRAKLAYDFKSDKELVKTMHEQMSFESYKDDFKTLKKLLMPLEVSVPVLYKQYSEICEEGGIKFCSFSIDPEFSQCIDSFIIVEVDKIKPSQRKRYMGE